MNIALIGEAWGEAEEEQGLPFVGPSGWILNSMLRQVGIRREECLVTNVFNLRPRPKNDILTLCGPRTAGIPGQPELQRGKYVRSEFAGELHRLHRELQNAKPNVIVALGATAAWAVLGTSGISRIRGYLADSPFGKVIPTYHPAAVARDWSLRPIAMMDLHKAKEQSTFPEYRRPRREVWIEPDLKDLLRFEHAHISPASQLSVDIETKGNTVTCIGFAPTRGAALVVPFYDPGKADGNYWPTVRHEILAWRWVQHVMRLGKALVGQNFVYDMAFTWRSMGIGMPGAEDTMLLHHALQPEMEKGLGFLASCYSEEQAWKYMGKRNTSTIKRGE